MRKRDPRLTLAQPWLKSCQKIVNVILTFSVGFEHPTGVRVRWPSTLKFALLLAALGLTAALVQRSTQESVAGPASVIDGDSLRILDREIRLRGIDAPELRQTCRNDRGEVPCGRDARAALIGLIGRGPVDCRLAGRDRYGRRLAACRAGDVDLNAAMVRGGHALAFGRHQAEEDEARAHRRGIWALTFDRPSEWRAAHPRSADP
jgi:endonuclease YncB( thermonuclease family)